MGMISVRLHGVLNERVQQAGDRGRAGGELRLPFEGAVKVRDVLERLGVSDKDVHLVFVGRKRVKLDEELRDGDLLAVYPPMAGG